MSGKLKTMKEGYDYLMPLATPPGKNNKGRKKPALKHSASDDSGVVDDKSTSSRHPSASSTPPSAEELGVVRQNTYQEEIGNANASQATQAVYQDLTPKGDQNELKYQELKNKRKSESNYIETHRKSNKSYSKTESRKSQDHRQSNMSYLTPESNRVGKQRGSTKSYMSTPEYEVLPYDKIGSKDGSSIRNRPKYLTIYGSTQDLSKT